MKVVSEDFSAPPGPRWKRYLRAGGCLEPTGATLRFVNRDAVSQQYTNAQIDDYQGLPRRRFPWRPSLKMTVRARFSHSRDELKGTAGFGFWNDPFFMTGKRLPALPRAIWFFFASPPSNMKLDLHAPGHGWKAATIDAARWPFFLLLPTAPVAVLLMNVRRVYRALWPLGQHAIGVSEAPIEAGMTEWHTFAIEWGVTTARFFVDGELVLDCGTPPRGRLGFVMWLDNQYAIVTPWGRFGHGLVDAPGRQWMEVDALIIEPG